jgi:ATP-dependent protease ClpP protease subunit
MSKQPRKTQHKVDPNCYRIRAQGREAELLIYGDIGESFWGESMTAREVAKQIQDLEVDALNVRINSYGGSVSDGIAIYNALRRHPAEIAVSVDGVAVSIASLIAMAGDTVEMGVNTLMMIHAPWGGIIGNAAEMRDMADVLDKYAEAMVGSYARKSGQDAEDLMALLTDGEDHWYTAQEAMDQGFADAVVEADSAALETAAAFDLGRYHMPAAVAAAFRPKPHTEDRTMPDKATAEQTPTVQAQAPAQPVAAPPASEPQAPPAPSPDAVRAEVFAAEQGRRAQIRNVFSRHIAREGMQQVLDACLDDMGCTVEAARDKALTKLGEGAEPLGGGNTIELQADARDKFRAGVQAALLVRARMAQPDSANEFRGHTLVELARASLEMAGVRTGLMDRQSMVSAAFTHGDSDFTTLLADTANKSLLKGWDEAEETYPVWTVPGELSDFKPAKRVDLNAFPALDDVTDTEYKYGTTGDRGETIVLASYGKLFSIRRKAIINDDLGAFTRIPQKLGRAARRTVGNLVYAVLTGNPNMADGVALFHANHSNLLTGAAISTASVDAMRVAMATQSDPSGNAAALNIGLGYLLTPKALEGTANVVRTSEYEVGATTRNNTTPNSVRDTFEVVADARLDASSAAEWYGSARPGMHWWVANSGRVAVGWRRSGADRPHGIYPSQLGYSVFRVPGFRCGTRQTPTA